MLSRDQVEWDRNGSAMLLECMTRYTRDEVEFPARLFIKLLETINRQAEELLRLMP